MRVPLAKTFLKKMVVMELSGKKVIFHKWGKEDLSSLVGGFLWVCFWVLGGFFWVFLMFSFLIH